MRDFWKANPHVWLFVMSYSYLFDRLCFYILKIANLCFFSLFLQVHI